MDRVPTAWMLRRDGEAFPVIQHLYGSLDCVEETLYAGEWLYRHTCGNLPARRCWGWRGPMSSPWERAQWRKTSAGP